ncbi:MAG: glycoside hydrolase family 28 protein [Verrucomicrobiota bacterium]
MNQKCFVFVACMLGCLLTAAAAPAPAAAAHNVRDFGAKGDGATKDTAAIQKALDACTNSGGTVVVPAGNFLTGSLVLHSHTTLRLSAGARLTGSPDAEDYPLVNVRWEGEFAEGHRALLSAERADNVSITGPGIVVGPPTSLSRLRNPRGPALIEIARANNVRLEGFSTQYQQLWSLHMLLLTNLTMSHLTIRSTNVNGDGIDVDSCSGVAIEHCDIIAGDDAISLKSGRGQAAARLASPTENVVIRDCKLYSSQFAALGIGTEMSGGIRNVRVENCTLAGRQNAIFFKSRDGRGGYIENITGENLVINPSPTFIAIDTVKKGIQASDPVEGPVEKWASLRSLTFKNVRVNDVIQLVAGANVPPERPVVGLTLTNITGTCRKGINLANITDAHLADIQVTGYEGPLLTHRNVTGTGLELDKVTSKP